MDNNSKKKTVTVDAIMNKLDKVMEFTDAVLEEAECPEKICSKISNCVEEIFVNIANYAYPENTIGGCFIEYDIVKNKEAGTGKIIITVRDQGREFNPLTEGEPDTSSSADGNGGGLGIFTVKKIMDRTEYKYENNENIFIMEKSW